LANSRAWGPVWAFQQRFICLLKCRGKAAQSGLGKVIRFPDSLVFKVTLASVGSPTGRSFCFIAVKIKWNGRRTSSVCLITNNCAVKAEAAARSLFCLGGQFAWASVAVISAEGSSRSKQRRRSQARRGSLAPHNPGRCSELGQFRLFDSQPDRIETKRPVRPLFNCWLSNKPARSLRVPFDFDGDQTKAPHSEREPRLQREIVLCRGFVTFTRAGFEGSTIEDHYFTTFAFDCAQLLEFQSEERDRRSSHPNHGCQIFVCQRYVIAANAVGHLQQPAT
jgi:hypothetical protein